MNIKTAIIQFLANEFHLDAEHLTEDTNFTSDLGLNSTQVGELLQNLQDSLNIILPVDGEATITTIGQLLAAVENEEGEDSNE